MHCKLLCAPRSPVRDDARRTGVFFGGEARSEASGHLHEFLCTSGVTTEEIDRLVHEYIVSEGAYPAAVNFFGFPKAVCASVNEGQGFLR